MYEGGQSHLTRTPTAEQVSSSDGPSGNQPTSGFKFDLGGALARLAGDAAPDQSGPLSSDLPGRPLDDPAGEIGRPLADRTTAPDRRPPGVTPLGARPIDPSAHLPPPGHHVAEPSGAPAPPAHPAPSVAPDLLPVRSVDRDAPHAAAPPAAAVCTTATTTTMTPAASPSTTSEAVPGTTTDPTDPRDRPPATPTLPAERIDRDDHIAQRYPQESVFEEKVDPYDPSVRGKDQSNDDQPGSPEQGAIVVPILPASNPIASPSMTNEQLGVSSRADVTALRSAQMRASRNRRQGKLFGRLLLALVVGGGMIAASMVFGRSLLFGTDWDPELTAIVNEIETERGAPFINSVPVEVLGADEFGERYSSSVIGDEWFHRVAEWRALGLATGEVSRAAVRAELVGDRRAHYDDRSGTILVLAGAGRFAGPLLDVRTDGVADTDAALDADADLRVALETAYVAQRVIGHPDEIVGVSVPGWVGMSSPSAVAERAVVRRVAERSAERPVVDDSLPVPIAYELAAVGALGDSVLVATDVEPDEIVLGIDLPIAIGNPLDDDPLATVSALLRPGERSLTDAVALGVDDWSLVWGTQLPEKTVARLVELVVADSYLPIERHGTTCAVGTFATVNETHGDQVYAAMLDWVANAPAATTPAVSRPAPTRVQLDVCDPGADVAVAPSAGTVDALIDRQQQRLLD